MKKIALLICCSLIAFTSCDHYTPAAVESQTIEPETMIQSKTDVKTYTVEPEIRIETKTDAITPSIETEAIAEDEESVDKEELKALGLLRAPTEQEKQQYEEYVKKVEEREPLSSMDEVIDEYTILTELITTTNQELKMPNAVVDFSIDDEIILLGFPAMPAYPMLRAKVINPISDNYDTIYEEYENQYELFCNLELDYIRTFLSMERIDYSSVKLMYDLNVAFENLLLLEESLEKMEG